MTVFGSHSHENILWRIIGVDDGITSALDYATSSSLNIRYEKIEVIRLPPPNVSSMPVVSCL